MSYGFNRHYTCFFVCRL